MKPNTAQIYVCSDTHFGHDKMSEWALRPADFNERLWKGFDTLPVDAILIHCGDVTIGADATTHIRLQKYPFKKWLVRGNHDQHSIGWYIRNGWDFVADEIVINAYGGNFLFTHEPLPKRDSVRRNIHGHLHGGKSRVLPEFYDENYHIEITPEVIGYTPIKLSQKL